jgi:hypothetical protein
MAHRHPLTTLTTLTTLAVVVRTLARLPAHPATQDLSYDLSASPPTPLRGPSPSNRHGLIRHGLIRQGGVTHQLVLSG